MEGTRQALVSSSLWARREARYKMAGASKRPMGS